MATYFDGSNAVQTSNVTGKFIPAVWSDEIVAAYKKNLVLANLVKRMNFKGKKGDTVYIPSPNRGTASAKAGATTVTIQAVSPNSNIAVSINKHYEYSHLIEDIVETQALTSLRQFYTDDAGYALAKQVDTDLIKLGRTFNGGAGARYAGAYIGGDGTTAYDYTTDNQSALTDAAIRRTIQRLDDNDVPMDMRYFIIPPATRNTMMGLARFTEQAFTGEVGGANSIRNGQIGDIYGVKVFVTTNADTPTTTTSRIALLFHPEFGVLVEQLGARVQTQYKQEYLATLLTADTLYGVGELRDTSAVAIAVPA